ncbi:MAG: hypothetical protein ACI4VP_04085 [Clostridia bacterium]
MDLYGIGFSNIRMSNVKNDYTYQYDYRINTFPEEVFIHEFLHTLERNLLEDGYEIPALHDYEKYGYKEERLIGLKNWYEDYMNCRIFDETTKKYIGLNEITYTLKPVHESDFKYSVEIEFNKEPQNILEEIKSLANVVLSVL